MASNQSVNDHRQHHHLYCNDSRMGFSINRSKQIKENGKKLHVISVHFSLRASLPWKFYALFCCLGEMVVDGDIDVAVNRVSFQIVTDCCALNAKIFTLWKIAGFF